MSPGRTLERLFENTRPKDTSVNSGHLWVFKSARAREGTGFSSWRLRRTARFGCSFLSQKVLDAGPGLSANRERRSPVINPLCSGPALAALTHFCPKVPGPPSDFPISTLAHPQCPEPTLPGASYMLSELEAQASEPAPDQAELHSHPGATRHRVQRVSLSGDPVQPSWATAGHVCRAGAGAGRAVHCYPMLLTRG